MSCSEETAHKSSGFIAATPVQCCFAPWKCHFFYLTRFVAPPALQKEEAERLLKQTEQQVSILKASLDRATKAKEHAEAQVRGGHAFDVHFRKRFLVVPYSSCGWRS